jgi:hypothetical protein
MRTDYIVNFNGVSAGMAKLAREVAAQKRREAERLERLAVSLDGFADTTQRADDETIAGDREPIPSFLRPVVGRSTSADPVIAELEAALAEQIQSENVPAEKAAA